MDLYDLVHTGDVLHPGDQCDLGLPLVREIALHFGGTATVEPTESDETVLRVRLPHQERSEEAGDDLEPADRGLASR